MPKAIFTFLYSIPYRGNRFICTFALTDKIAECYPKVIRPYVRYSTWTFLNKKAPCNVSCRGHKERRSFNVAIFRELEGTFGRLHLLLRGEFHECLFQPLFRVP